MDYEYEIPKEQIEQAAATSVRWCLNNFGIEKTIEEIKKCEKSKYYSYYVFYFNRYTNNKLKELLK